MMSDEETRKEDLDFVENNIDQLAAMSVENFIDPVLRPKNKRVKFTAKFYKESMLENIHFWREAPVADYMRFVYGVKGFALSALDNQFDHWRQVWLILNTRRDEEQEKEDAAKKAKKRALRVTQQDMPVFDANRQCLACFKYIFMYDETNNKRHEKNEVCTCKSSRHLQAQMRAKISAYRARLADKKKIPKKDPRRYEK